MVYRKHNRLKRACYAGMNWYFITICAEGREQPFRLEALVGEHINVLRQLCPDMGFNVYAYCFMPDHVHLLLVSERSQSDLIDFIKRYKQHTGYTFKKRYSRSLWQKGFFDHILRRGETPDAVAYYIFQNPVRSGLVSEMLDYPYSGSFMFDARRFHKPIAVFKPPWRVEG